MIHPLINSIHIGGTPKVHEGISWDTYWLSMAILVSMKSKDRHTRAGTIIVTQDNTLVQTGFNSPPRHVRDDIQGRFERPEKYTWMSHAEQNAVVNCARLGLSTLDCKLYVNFMPCPDCAKTIIQAGINLVVIPAKWECMRMRRTSEADDRLYDASYTMFHEAGVTLHLSQAPIINDIIGLYRGEEVK